MVGGAGVAEVLEVQRRGHHLFNLRCLVWPLMWNCQGDAPVEDTGQLCQPGVPTSVGLQLSVEWWAGATIGQHQEEGQGCRAKALWEYASIESAVGHPS